jgi:hypothetical protein
MLVNNINKKEVSTKTIKTDRPTSQPANYKTTPPLRPVITGNRLFSLFTADIMRQDVIFTK